MFFLPLALFSLALVGSSRIKATVAALPSDRDVPPPKAEGGPNPFVLKSSRLTGKIDGMVARLELSQTFENRNPVPVEAVYVFPLPEHAAVDGYSFSFAGKEIRGAIRRREDAQKEFQAARGLGEHVGPLLDQERPNVFTQTLANLPSGQTVEVRIRLDMELHPLDGRYSFAFPTVVGPRFFPAGQVPDQERISPPVLAPGEPNPHRIAIDLDLQSPLPIHGLRSLAHRIDTASIPGGIHLSTSPGGETPNRDFQLQWSLGQERPDVAMVVDSDTAGGHFLLMLEPPATVDSSALVPREVVLLMDQSGSMAGQPLSIVQAAARALVERLRPSDRVRLVSFAEAATSSADTAELVTERTRAQALDWIDRIRAGGGTQMLAGVEKALSAPLRKDLQRLVILMTDGYVGDEERIVQAVRRWCDDRTRVHVLGVGSSVNRYLVELAAEAGRGTAFVAQVGKDPSEVVDQFWSQLQSPVVTGLSVDWGGLGVDALEPSEIPDLYAGVPLHLVGRLTGRGPRSAVVTITGRTRRSRVAWKVPVDLDRPDVHHPAIGALWARRRIARLTRPWEPPRQQEVVDLSLRHSILSPWTSFLAVMDSVVTTPGGSKRVQVPVPLPQGTTSDALSEPAYRSGLELQSGSIQGFVDQPQKLYVLQEDSDPMAGIDLARPAPKVQEPVRCGATDPVVDTVDIHSGAAHRLRPLAREISARLAQIAAVVPADLPWLDLEMELDAAGRVGLVSAAGPLGSPKVPATLAPLIEFELPNGDGEGTVKFRLRLRFPRLPCPPLPAVEPDSRIP